MQYVKVHNSIWDNPRFLSLPSSEAKLAFYRVMSAAKDSDPEGQWPSLDYLKAALRADAWAIPHLDHLFAAGLIGTDEDGRVHVSRSPEKWAYWQKWEGKRPAGQLATENPALLKRRQEADARRKRIADWVRKGMARIDDCPDDIREDVFARLSGGVSAETHDHTDVRTNGRTSTGDSESPVETAPADASQSPHPDSSGRVGCTNCDGPADEAGWCARCQMWTCPDCGHLDDDEAGLQPLAHNCPELPF